MKARLHWSQGMLFIGAILLSVSLSCNLVSIGRLKRANQDPVPVSSEAAQQLVDNIENAAATAVAGGTVTIVITESQLTSLAVLEMQDSVETDIQNLQIHLQDGLVRISGQVKNGNLSMNASIDVKITADTQGQPHSEIVSARVGPFPVPESMLNDITSGLDQFLIDQINSSGDQVFIQQISIADGKMTITGNLK
jgi:hypothetical protein